MIDLFGVKNHGLMRPILNELPSNHMQETILWQFELETGFWNKILAQTLNVRGELMSVQGILHYILYADDDIGYWKLDWIDLGYYYHKKENVFKQLPKTLINFTNTETFNPFLMLCNCYVK